MNGRRGEYAELTLNDINLLHARPFKAEIRATWTVMALLLLGFVIAIPFAAEQWPESNLLYAGAGIAAFAEITTGLLLLTQALLLRHDPGLALGLGYLLGGMVIVVNLLCVQDVATRLWLFRFWHGVFVLGVFVYALMNAYGSGLFKRNGFWVRARLAIGGGLLLIVLLALYLVYRPFPLPVILRDVDYATPPNLWVNGVQFVAMVIAWVALVTARRKTVLSIWMAVVACAVAIDIVLFVLGGKLFSAGLYISKLNNFIAGTLIFGMIFYRFVRIQTELLKHRVWLVRANRRLARLALTDTLTCLPNRAALDQYLEHALARASREETLLAVCVIDLDDFKPVNDRHGHEMGDRLLGSFAKRLSSLLRKGEYFARLGGDEFVLVLEDLHGMEQLPAVLKRITAALAEPFELSEDIAITVHASIGVSVYPYIDSGRDLLRVADQALYRSKEGKVAREQSWVIHSAEIAEQQPLFG
ncbi:MAG: GGDEF domain-containing protein [Gammaproteobacteria bacterium]